MAYAVVKNVDAKTRDGRKAIFKDYSDHNWPAPWCFEVDGETCWYSIGGFVGNHQLDSHPLDLVEPWDAPSRKIDISELQELFGETIPIEVATLLMSKDLTLDEKREQITVIADRAD